MFCFEPLQINAPKQCTNQAAPDHHIHAYLGRIWFFLRGWCVRVGADGLQPICQPVAAPLQTRIIQLQAILLSARGIFCLPWAWALGIVWLATRISCCSLRERAALMTHLPRTCCLLAQIHRHCPACPILPPDTSIELLFFLVTHLSAESR